MTQEMARKLAASEETVWDWQLVEKLAWWEEYHRMLAKSLMESIFGPKEGGNDGTSDD